MPVSFSKDVKPMFREVDIDHMKVHGVRLDDLQYMSDATNDYANAQAVQGSLVGRTMPPGGPFWTVMKRLLSLLALFAAAASAGTLYLPAYPAAVLVFDESKGQVVDRIPLETGTPMSMRLAPDHKKIYVTTIDHNGIEVIDVATRKVINHFVLNTATSSTAFAAARWTRTASFSTL
jgi:DNA-binding beta-propeller fold protein YncE